MSATEKTKKSIDTLVDDVFNLFEEENEVVVDDAVLEAFGQRVAQMVKRRLNELRHHNDENKIRMSNLGKPDCQLYYIEHAGELGEELTPKTKLKFLYGEFLEELYLLLAELAGHEVRGQQDALVVDGIAGHRDAVIDGVLVDVKSASSFGFQKFQQHGLLFDDAFGYLTQAGAYLHASTDVDPTKMAFVAIDKTTGGVCLDVYTKEELPDPTERIAGIRKVLSKPEFTRCFEDEEDGKSGNRKLGTVCSYCPFKESCWSDANNGDGLRMFLYASRPRWLTKVEREPNVPEIVDGKIKTE